MRRRKLSPEEKKRVWSLPESNGGCGWHARGNHQTTDGFTAELRGPRTIPNLPLDDIEQEN